MVTRLAGEGDTAPAAVAVLRHSGMSALARGSSRALLHGPCRRERRGGEGRPGRHGRRSTRPSAGAFVSSGCGGGLATGESTHADETRPALQTRTVATARAPITARALSLRARLFGRETGTRSATVRATRMDAKARAGKTWKPYKAARRTAAESGGALPWTAIGAKRNARPVGPAPRATHNSIRVGARRGDGVRSAGRDIAVAPRMTAEWSTCRRVARSRRVRMLGGRPCR